MCRPSVEGITKIRAHEVIAECRPNFGNAIDQDIKLSQLKDMPEIQYRNRGATGGGHYEKRNCLRALG
jgi:hypothetical protein